MSETEQSTPGRRRPIRASFVFLVAAVVIGLSGVGVLALIGSRTVIYVASTDLPAYHQIVERDVRRIEVGSRDVPEGALTNRDGLVGRYTLVSLAQDRAYTADALGPILQPGALNGLRLIAIEGSPETSVGDTLTRGDRVDVLFSTTADRPRPRPVMLADILVVDVRARGDDTSLVLGVTDKDEGVLLEKIGTSRLVVARTKPYARP